MSKSKEQRLEIISLKNYESDDTTNTLIEMSSQINFERKIASVFNFLFWILITFSTLVFIRLTIVLPTVLKISQNKYDAEIHVNSFIYNLRILIGEDFLLQPQNISLLFFIFVRILCIPLLPNEGEYERDKFKKIWLNTVNSWIGIFTVFSLIAILMVGQ